MSAGWQVRGCKSGLRFYREGHKYKLRARLQGADNGGIKAEQMSGRRK